MAATPASQTKIDTKSDAYEMRVLLYGYNDFKKLLKQVDPDLRKAMDKEIRGFITPVSALAKSLVPAQVMRNWRKSKNPRQGSRWGERGWDQGDVQKGIVVRQSTKRVRGAAVSGVWQIQNKSAAGAIYETAGRRSAGDGIAGQSFVAAITLRGGRPSRLIWRAWDQLGGEKEITKNVIETINKYENELQAALDAAGKD